MDSPTYIHVFVFALLAILLYVAQKMLSYFSNRLIKDQNLRLLWKRYYGTFTLIVWMIFGLLSIEYFSTHNRLIAILITIVVAIASIIVFFYYFKETIIGIIFKLNSNLKVGDVVKNKDCSGKVSRIDHHQICLESEDGSISGIAYSKVIFNPLIKQSPSPYLFRFEEMISILNQIDRDTVYHKALKFLSGDIRINNTVAPKIEFIDKDKDSSYLKVTAFLFRQTDSEAIRDRLYHLLDPPEQKA